MYRTEEKRREEDAVLKHRYEHWARRRAGMTDQERAADSAKWQSERDEVRACWQKGIVPVAPGSVYGVPGQSGEDDKRGRSLWYSLCHPHDVNAVEARDYRDAYFRGDHPRPAPERQAETSDTTPAPGGSIFIR